MKNGDKMPRKSAKKPMNSGPIGNFKGPVFINRGEDIDPKEFGNEDRHYREELKKK